MMMLRAILLAFLLLGGAVTVAAQEDEREIYTVLAYGDEVFEPELWLVGAQEAESRTTATWNSETLGALAYADYLHFDEGIGDIDSYFDDEWFEITLENYDQWKLVDDCALDDDAQLRWFDLTDDDIEYTMYYWTRAESDTRVLAFFIVFPKDNQADLATYSERFDPAFADCEMG